MASAHTLPIAIDRCYRKGFFQEDDPGASGTLTFQNKGHVIFLVTTAAAESRALESATHYSVGTRCLVVLKTDGGDLTITGAESSVLLQDAGAFAEFVVTDNNGTLVWRLAAVDGGGYSSETKNAEIPIDTDHWKAVDRAALGATVDTGDMALIVGTFGTSNPTLMAGTTHTTNTADFGAIGTFQVPPDHIPGTDITFSIVVVENTACSNPDLEVAAYNRDSPNSDIVGSGADQDATGGGTFTVTLTGTSIAPGDVIDVRVNLELTDDGTAASDYDVTRVTYSYTGSAV